MSFIAATERILLAGNGRLAYSLAINLVRGGNKVVLFSQHRAEAERYFGVYRKDFSLGGEEILEHQEIEIVETLPEQVYTKLAIAITEEDVEAKMRMIEALELRLAPDCPIAINSETISLALLQKRSRYADRIFLANWVEPVDSSFFLEIVSNEITNRIHVENFENKARIHWGKDPFVIEGNTGIRTPLMAAMVREALYLVQNGYASPEDIDRTCRNDPGYYLPFAGNLRYMDLMGTNVYGMVMKELNPELSTSTKPDDSFLSMLKNGEVGMRADKGFYEYGQGESERWEKVLRKFSHQIYELIGKYPFNYEQKKTDL